MMNKAKLKEILANSKDAFRVYRDEYGNVWQVIPQEEYMKLVHIKEEVISICKCIELLEVDGDDTKAQVKEILKQLVLQNDN